MKYFVLLLSLTILIGCQKNIKQIISVKIRHDCSKKDSCIININDVTDFEWDTMILVKACVTPEVLNNTLGFKSNYSMDTGDRIFFLKSQKVVYYYSEDPDIEETPNGYVFFEYKNCYLKLSRKFAVFKVLSINDGKRTRYILINNKN